MTVEVLTLALAVASELVGSGAPRVRSVLVTAGLVLLLVPAATIGTAMLAGVPEAVLAAFLAFGAAALLFLATEELLAEAHEVPETSLGTALFFVGFLALFLVEFVT